MSPILEASILEAQQRGVEIGRLRMGAKVEFVKDGKAKERPSKLENWRLTSPSRHAIEAAAELLGGEAREWKSPTGPQWEVYSASPVLDVIVPPGEVVEQFYEMWTGGGCVRRCTGAGGMNQIDNTPCACPSDPKVRRDLAVSGRACKPTTRLRISLPTLPGIGVWRVESHGYYAAVELVGRHELLRQAAAAGVWIPARLRLEQRSRGGKDYGVPVLDVGASMLQIASGEGVGTLPQALGAAQPAAIGVGDRPAIEASAAPAREDAPAAPPQPELTPAERAVKYAEAARKASTREEVANLVHHARKAELMDEWVPGAPGDPDITLEDLMAGQLERVSSAAA